MQENTINIIKLSEYHDITPASGLNNNFKISHKYL